MASTKTPKHLVMRDFKIMWDVCRYIIAQKKYQQTQQNTRHGTALPLCPVLCDRCEVCWACSVQVGIQTNDGLSCWNTSKRNENKQANKETKKRKEKQGNKHPLKNMSSIPKSISVFSAFESLQPKKNCSHLLNLWQWVLKWWIKFKQAANIQSQVGHILSFCSTFSPAKLVMLPRAWPHPQQERLNWN